MTNTTNNQKPANQKTRQTRTATAQVKKPAYYCLAKGYPYPSKSHVLKRSCTLAALVVSGYMTISKAGTCTATKAGGDYAKFADITRNKVNRVWDKSMLSDSGKFIPKAQSAMNTAHAGGYNGQRPVIDSFIKLMKSGGKLAIKDADGKQEIVSFTATDSKA